MIFIEVCSVNNGEACFNILFTRYRKEADKRNIEFLLTKEEFKSLTQCNCHYCNSKPSQIIHNRTTKGDYIYNGIDRIDSALGYVIGNVVSCCKQCNYAKLDHSYDEFVFQIKTIYEYSRLLNSMGND
jgi:5-methylcytosine-specific restriction endonuclease McrA